MKWRWATYPLALATGFAVVAANRAMVNGKPVAAWMKAGTGRVHLGKTGDALLDGVVSKVEGDLQRRIPTKEPHLFQDAKKLKDTLVRAKDIAATARLALEGLDGKSGDAFYDKAPEATVRLYHWLEEDPEAALAYLQASGNRRQLAELGAYAMGFYTSGLDSAGMYALASQSPALIKDHTFVNSTASKLIKDKDIDSLLALQKLCDESQAPLQMSRNWPKDDPNGFADFAIRAQKPELISRFMNDAGLSHKQAIEWVEGLVASNADPDFIRGLQNDRNISGLYLMAKDLPLEERIAGAMRLSGGEERSPYDRDGMAGLMAFVAAIGSGDPNAPAVPVADQFAKFAASNPELVAAFPDQAIVRVFQVASLRDPDGAMELFADQSPKVRSEAVLAAVELIPGASSQWIRSSPGDPQKVHDLLSKVPYEPEMGPIDDRLAVWQRMADNSVGTYGDDYTDWVMALPEGMDRNLALISLANNLDKTDPDRGATLRAMAGPIPTTAHAPGQ